MPIWAARCIRTRACIRPTACPRWCAPSTTPCSVPTRSIAPNGLAVCIGSGRQIHRTEGAGGLHWFAPIVADAEAGFGGRLNAFELMKGMIEAGAAAVHFEDQLSSAKKCGHLGGKVVVPISEFVQ